MACCCLMELNRQKMTLHEEVMCWVCCLLWQSLSVVPSTGRSTVPRYVRSLVRKYRCCSACSPCCCWGLQCLLTGRAVGTIFGPKVPRTKARVKSMFPLSVAQTDCTVRFLAQNYVGTVGVRSESSDAFAHKTANVSRILHQRKISRISLFVVKILHNEQCCN